jgi:hypothetical protein
MYKVRFHLARGENFRKWQVLHNGKREYYDPESVSLVMEGCRLHNNPRVARIINAQRSQCAPGCPAQALVLLTPSPQANHRCFTTQGSRQTGVMAMAKT